MYDIDVTGYGNHTIKLHLFDIEGVDESIVGNTIDFDKAAIQKNLTLFLYPDESAGASYGLDSFDFPGAPGGRSHGPDDGNCCSLHDLPFP